MERPLAQRAECAIGIYETLGLRVTAVRDLRFHLWFMFACINDDA